VAITAAFSDLSPCVASWRASSPVWAHTSLRPLVIGEMIRYTALADDVLCVYSFLRRHIDGYYPLARLP
jgi:hypothetical protein